MGAFLLLAGLAAPPAHAVPSFARQTGMACSACHTVFPELTPFGREFKLNAYVIDNIRQIKGETMERRETLALNSIPPLSMMVQISYSHTSKALPDSQVSGALAKDGDVLFPDQVSFFYAGKIANDLGAFMQLTYSGAADHFGIDNTDIRYARYLSQAEPDEKGASGSNSWFSTHDVLVGITLNNNPTVQDVWNTIPAWGFPYVASSISPSPAASSKIASIGQTAAGLGVYTWIDHSLYVEFSGYAAAQTGGVHPLDSQAANVLRGFSPYWRAAYEYHWDRNSLEVGTYGINASILPGGGHPLSGPTDRFTDTAIDAQYQYIGEESIFTVLATYIHENGHLDASVPQGLASNSSDTLNTAKATFEYAYRRMINASLGYFSTTGTTDPLLYAQAPVTGSATGAPNSRGYIFEFDYLPFLNTKLTAQYTGYSKFNGGSTNYDGSGRSASDNNVLYLQLWISF
ncbi:MAG TPA: hypothetical protein VKT22_13805 [Steroidobacteraceae bacterium]|nr:hypothetical protein [Steroidobacteraceae bacterium]